MARPPWLVTRDGNRATGSDSGSESLPLSLPVRRPLRLAVTALGGTVTVTVTLVTVTAHGASHPPNEIRIRIQIHNISQRFQT